MMSIGKYSRRLVPFMLMFVPLLLAACGSPQPDLTQTYVAALTYTPSRAPATFLVLTADIDFTRTAAAELATTAEFNATQTAQPTPTPSPTRYQPDPASLPPSRPP